MSLFDWFRRPPRCGHTCPRIVGAPRACVRSLGHSGQHRTAGGAHWEAPAPAPAEPAPAPASAEAEAEVDPVDVARRHALDAARLILAAIGDLNRWHAAAEGAEHRVRQLAAHHRLADAQDHLAQARIHLPHPAREDL